MSDRQPPAPFEALSAAVARLRALPPVPPSTPLPVLPDPWALAQQTTVLGLQLGAALRRSR